MVNITLMSLPHLIKCEVPWMTHGWTLSGRQPSVWYIPASLQMPRNALCCIPRAVKTGKQNCSALYSLRDHQGYFSPANMEISYVTLAHNWINKARAPYCMCYWLEILTLDSFLSPYHTLGSHTLQLPLADPQDLDVVSFFFFLI